MQGFLFKKQHQSHFLSSTVTQPVIVVFYLLFSVLIPQIGKYSGADPHRHVGSAPQLGTDVPDPDLDLDPSCAYTLVPAGEGGWQRLPGGSRNLGVKILSRGGRALAHVPCPIRPLLKHKFKGRLITNRKTVTMEH